MLFFLFKVNGSSVRPVRSSEGILTTDLLYYLPTELPLDLIDTQGKVCTSQEEVEVGNCVRIVIINMIFFFSNDFLFYSAHCASS